MILATFIAINLFKLIKFLLVASTILTLIVIPAYILLVPEWKKFTLNHQVREYFMKKPIMKILVFIIGFFDYFILIVALIELLR